MQTSYSNAFQSLMFLCDAVVIPEIAVLVPSLCRLTCNHLLKNVVDFRHHKGANYFCNCKLFSELFFTFIISD